MSFGRASFFCISICLWFTGCSLYKSDARKFLESQAFTFANSTSALSQWSFEAYQVEEPCAELLQKPQLSEEDWGLMEKTKDMERTTYLYQSETENAFEVLMYVKKQDRHYLCSFYYSDLQHRLEGMDNDLNIGYQTIKHLEQF